jgi:hypothetical protein
VRRQHPQEVSPKKKRRSRRRKKERKAHRCQRKSPRKEVKEPPIVEGIIIENGARGEGRKGLPSEKKAKAAEERRPVGTATGGGDEKKRLKKEERTAGKRRREGLRDFQNPLDHLQTDVRSTGGIPGSQAILHPRGKGLGGKENYPGVTTQGGQLPPIRGR